jgi:hypothetical protein
MTASPERLSGSATIDRVDIERLVKIARDHGISYLALFGSFARGTATGESDVDLAVRFGRPIDLLEFAGIQIEIEQALQRQVDLVPLDQAYPFVRESMQNDLLVLYDAADQDPEADVVRE